MMSNQQKAAALYASMALGAMEALLQLEKPRSARHNRINNTIDGINRVVDLYRLDAFAPADMANAARLLDLLNEEIVRLYPVEVEKPLTTEVTEVHGG